MSASYFRELLIWDLASQRSLEDSALLLHALVLLFWFLEMSALTLSTGLRTA